MRPGRLAASRHASVASSFARVRAQDAAGQDEREAADGLRLDDDVGATAIDPIGVQQPVTADRLDAVGVRRHDPERGLGVPLTEGPARGRPELDASARDVDGDLRRRRRTRSSPTTTSWLMSSSIGPPRWTSTISRQTGASSAVSARTVKVRSLVVVDPARARSAPSRTPRAGPAAPSPARCGRRCAGRWT